MRAALAAAATGNDLLDAILNHRGLLISVANRILRSRDLAEDVVQDAAVKVCQLTGAPAAAYPLRFTCGIVRNLALDRARRRTLERRHADDSEAPDVAAPLVDAERRLEDRDALACVRAAVAELPERTRLAFLLHRLHGHPQKTIAARLGVSPTLVNFMIRRAEAHCAATLAGRDLQPWPGADCGRRCHPACKAAATSAG